MTSITRVPPTTRFGGVDGDTEINGCAVDDQFIDIVWMAAGLNASLFPLPLILPLPEEECADIAVPCDQPLVVAADTAMVVT